MSEQEKKIAERILGEYEEKRETTLDRLKKTHAKAQKPALLFAYIFGGIAALIMGAGMSLVMTDFAGLGDSMSMILGIVLGVVGMGMAAVNYPIFVGMRKKGLAKYAAEVAELKKELLGE